MLPNPFIGKRVAPTDTEVAAELGSVKALWDQLLDEVAKQFDSPGREWHSYSAKAGWSLKVKDGERTIFYMSPRRGSILVFFALGDKAVKAALNSDLPAAVVKLIREAKRYAEGTAVQLEIKKSNEIALVKKLAAAKLEN